MVIENRLRATKKTRLGVGVAIANFFVHSRHLLCELKPLCSFGLSMPYKYYFL
jgi:hypothetical protein